MFCFLCIVIWWRRIIVKPEKNSGHATRLDKPDPLKYPTFNKFSPPYTDHGRKQADSKKIRPALLLQPKSDTGIKREGINFILGWAEAM